MTDTADQLRQAFDRRFTEAPVARVGPLDVLVVRAGGAPYAIVRAEIAALRTDLGVVSVPSPSPALLGVVAVRGAILPVWDLGRLVHGEPVTGRRWLAIVRGETAVVAIDVLDGHVRVAAPLGDAVQHAGVAYRVLDLAGALAAYRGSAR